MSKEIKLTMEEIQIKPWEYKCMFFCPHFFKAYRTNGKIANINARYDNQEAIFTCKECSKQLKSYIPPSNPLFFNAIKRC